jgi:hypothetical protein
MVTFLQTVGCAIAVYWYNKPEVYQNHVALLLLPLVTYVLYSYLDGKETTAKVYSICDMCYRKGSLEVKRQI